MKNLFIHKNYNKVFEEVINKRKIDNKEDLRRKMYKVFNMLGTNYTALITCFTPLYWDDKHKDLNFHYTKTYVNFILNVEKNIDDGLEVLTEQEKLILSKNNFNPDNYLSFRKRYKELMRKYKKLYSFNSFKNLFIKVYNYYNNSNLSFKEYVYNHKNQNLYLFLYQGFISKETVAKIMSWHSDSLNSISIVGILLNITISWFTEDMVLLLLDKEKDLNLEKYALDKDYKPAWLFQISSPDLSYGNKLVEVVEDRTGFVEKTNAYDFRNNKLINLINQANNNKEVYVLIVDYKNQSFRVISINNAKLIYEEKYYNKRFNKYSNRLYKIKENSQVFKFKNKIIKDEGRLYG